MKDWTLLNNSKSYIIQGLIKEWTDLLNKKEKEEAYHSFLARYAGFFLADDSAFVVISKLKLASELETDFVIVRDGHSDGTIYEFIEIEKPWSKLFTKKGIPTNDFNTSLQQIRDWRRWLIDNKSYFHKYLPTTNNRVIRDTNLRFKIIIGLRDNPLSDFEKRIQIARDNNIEIRSFDSLTDTLSRKFFFPYSYLNDKDRLTHEDLIQIANPFNMALSDSEWREICDNERMPSTHIYSKISDMIVRKLKQNELFDMFMK